jgi:phage portal protein BeeE
MTSSSVFSPENHEVDVKDGERLSDMLKRHHQGVGNAGKPLILPQAFKLIDKSTTNKDMDYMMLIDVDENRVYRLFNIPLPLVKSSTMTQSNYETAIPFLYSDAVLPTFNNIAEELTMKLLGRFKTKEVLSFDEFDIPALNAYQVKIMGDLSKTNAVTTNEIRKRGGYEQKPEADEIMISAGLVKLNDNSGGYE